MTTANSNLKRHIRNFHRELWLTNTQKNGWKNLHSQVSTQSVALQGKPCEEFDVDKFHPHIVRFIVADNQVSQFVPLLRQFLTTILPQSINVVECPELQSLLLLLRSNLQDAMIPCQTNVCQMILEAWNIPSIP
jgi:hypothetical protein